MESCANRHIDNSCPQTDKTSVEEYLDLLKEFGIEYDDRFVFKPVEIDYIVPDGTK